MTTDTTLWQTKLAARLHDPAEKALVLLRDPAGHENGTSRALTRLLGFQDIGTDTLDPDNDEALVRTVFKKGIPADMYRHVQRADWWAAAADRPQWPMEEITITTKKGKEKTLKIADWAQVRWTNKPVLIHPLTAEQYDLGQHGGLSDTDFKDIKQRSFDHQSRLIAALERQNPGQELDWRTALLTLWRFAPELSEETDNGTLGELWKLLPADTRIPDHSIWDHLDLTSAFAGAFAADDKSEVALLSLSIGPVQPFIAAARKMEDLWAGSHLLARLSWEAMRVVCERLGPDAILFPRLRGVPQVDLWLRDTCGLPPELFENCEWRKSGTDSNPLFAAALPNRFVAVVPAKDAKDIAQAVESTVRDWLQQLGDTVVQELLEAAGYPADAAQTPVPFAQMREQLQGFPEVHWAAVPFSLIGIGNKDRQTDLDVTELSEAMRPFFGTAPGQPCGFLDTPAWRLLQKDLQLNGATFFAPNPGVLYPAVHDLAERALAAAKALRPFAQSEQKGWRCSLSGETEWLATDLAQLALSAGQRTDTLWTRIAQKKPAWAKKGEHLGALPAIKRLWPTLFAKEAGKALRKKNEIVDRFIVSTHTMALAHQLDQWLEHGGLCASDLPELQENYRKDIDAVALPRRLMLRHQSVSSDALKDAAQLPALLDLADDDQIPERDASAIRRAVRQTLTSVRENQSDDRLETYYSLLLMDGDRMGAWLAGEPRDGQDYAISYHESFHPKVQEGFDKHASEHKDIRKYGDQKRALSPNRHLAISGALNDFSLTVVRHVVENEHLGRLIYAGGDDVFAMLPVADLLPAMQRLRHAYSGIDPEHEGGRDARGLTLHNGFALLNGKLMRMMGSKATASCGAVIAHHQAPLSAVRRELHAAEQRAKNEGERDAFSITIVKRSGGALRLTAKWDEPVKLLQDLRRFLAADGVSRRAAYHTLQWLDGNELPQPLDGEMLQSLLAYQLARQAQGDAKRHAPELAQRLATHTLQQPKGKQIDWLRNFISVAEFLAREVRSEAAA
ncbi:type III-B CRISPR-associated protein Cas10/Cmr2 [Thauera butanivorans]|uniref:type III-B CRISPR-associated protein Cas10/Cmr2 n=1 Tax=Thauera butanivorans TaxID=86174 RepID=UPI000837CC21|nr:type III-B CRISPR-associated protein Cas10/Cmr2 [Thauera butanivorans]